MNTLHHLWSECFPSSSPFFCFCVLKYFLSARASYRIIIFMNLSWCIDQMGKHWNSMNKEIGLKISFSVELLDALSLSCPPSSLITLRCTVLCVSCCWCPECSRKAEHYNGFQGRNNTAGESLAIFPPHLQPEPFIRKQMFSSSSSAVAELCSVVILNRKKWKHATKERDCLMLLTYFPSFELEKMRGNRLQTSIQILIPFQEALLSVCLQFLVTEDTGSEVGTWAWIMVTNTFSCLMLGTLLHFCCVSISRL